MQYKTILFTIFSLIGSVGTAQASNTDNIETAGDILQVALPLIGAGLSISNDDDEGLIQLAKAGGSTFLTVHALKRAVGRERPNGSDNHSFPSGHTAAAFTGASFIHKRYRSAYSWTGYVAATFVGYSRVAANKHYKSDVLAGAAIAYGFNDFFVTNPDIAVLPLISKDSITLNMQFAF